MRNLFCRCELNAVQAVAGAAMVTVALFAWAVGLRAVSPADPDIDLDRPYWLLWQLGALVIAFAGVWQLWFSTRQVAWTRSLALAAFTVAVFINAYTDGFGDYGSEVWLTVNPLFIAFSSVAALAFWRCGVVAGRLGAVIIAVLVAVDFVNAYFTNYGVVWQIMNPLMMLAALVWVAGANKANTAVTAASE